MKENKPTVWLLWLDNMRNLSFFLWLTGRRVWFWLVSRKDDGMKRWEADRGRRQTGRQGQDTQTLGRQRRRDVLTEGMAVNELRWQLCYQATCEWTIRKRCHDASPCIWFLQNIIDLTEWKCTTMHQGDSQHRQQIRTGTFSFKFILCPWTSWHTVTGNLLRFTCCGLASGKSMLPVTLQGGGWIYVPQLIAVFPGSKAND